MASFAPLSALNRAIRENDLAEVTRQLSSEPGLRAVDCRAGISRWEWDLADPRLINPFGFVRGGYASVFADALMSSAIGSLLAEGELATTAEMKIAFLQPAAPGRLRGEGRVVRKGSRVAFLEAEIRDAADQLLTTVTSTWTVIRSR